MDYNVKVYLDDEEIMSRSWSGTHTEMTAQVVATVTHTSTTSNLNVQIIPDVNYSANGGSEDWSKSTPTFAITSIKSEYDGNSSGAITVGANVPDTVANSSFIETYVLNTTPPTYDYKISANSTKTVRINSAADDPAGLNCYLYSNAH